MNIRKPLAALALTATLLTISAHSWAWKPTTHVYLAEMALRDALDDGKVSFVRVNYSAGQALTQKIGDYEVDPTLLTALRRYPQFYRTGVLGPDAQPDILTGQRVIHPEVAPGGGGLVPKGANAWLKHIWRQAAIIPGEKGLKARAYAAGYLTHAAGDMYAHTFVNYFTGKEFEIGRNGAEHIFLESYLARRTPNLTPDMYNAAMDPDLADFIYQTLVRMSPNSPLDNNLYGSVPEAATSIPWVFSKLRNRLQIDIDAYNMRIADYDTRIAAADFVTANALRIEKGAFVTANGLQTAYKQKWTADIDRGLRAWPFTSHEIAKALFFNPGGLNIAKASDEAEKYKNTYLLSMLGLPDFVGLASSIISQIRDIIIPPALKTAVLKFAQEKLLDVLLMNAYGMTSGQMLNEVKDPRTLWSQMMQSPRPGAPVRVPLTTMNRDFIKLADADYSNPSERFDTNRFAPAFNTIVMSKLVLLGNASATRLMTDLAKPPPTTSTSGLFKPFKSSLLMQATTKISLFAREIGGFNLMLNFDRSMDRARQWKDNPEKMLIYGMNVYERIFLKQAGE